MLNGWRFSHVKNLFIFEFNKTSLGEILFNDDQYRDFSCDAKELLKQLLH